MLVVVVGCDQIRYITSVLSSVYWQSNAADESSFTVALFVTVAWYVTWSICCSLYHNGRIELCQRLREWMRSGQIICRACAITAPTS